MLSWQTDGKNCFRYTPLGFKRKSAPHFASYLSVLVGHTHSAERPFLSHTRMPNV